MITVAIVKDDRVYFGSGTNKTEFDSLGQVDSNMRNYALKSAKNTVVATEGNWIVSNIIRCFNDIVQDKDFVDGVEFDKNYIVNYSLKYIRDALVKSNYLDKDEKINNMHEDVLIGRKNKLYFINELFDIKEVKHSCGIAENFDVLDNYIEQLGYDKDPIYIILKSIHFESKRENEKYPFPIIIRDTLNPKKVRVFDEIDTLKYIKKYEKGGNK